MAGRHHDAGRSAELAHRKAQGGHRLDTGEEEGPYPIGCENRRRRAHEELAVVAAIAGDGDGWRVEVRFEVIGNALGRLPHRVDVHAVGARPEHAAQTRRPEGKILEEGVFERRRIARSDEVGKLRGDFGVSRALGPAIDGALQTHVIPVLSA